MKTIFFILCIFFSFISVGQEKTSGNYVAPNGIVMERQNNPVNIQSSISDPVEGNSSQTKIQLKRMHITSERILTASHIRASVTGIPIFEGASEDVIVKKVHNTSNRIIGPANTQPTISIPEN